jgi:exodeoxyribonuclease III
MKIISYNVNGLRSILRKDTIDGTFSFVNFINHHDPDILCISEVKLNKKNEHVLDEILTQYPYKYWDHHSDQTSKHGVAVMSKYKPLNVSYSFGKYHNDKAQIISKFSGRYVQLEFESFCLISVYVPNSGTRVNALDERINEWDVEIFLHLNTLKRYKDIIYTGDLNVVHLEKDTFNFKRQRNKVAGVFDVERDNFQALLDSGFINVYRELHPRKVEYTYFTYLYDARATNTGMTLDYFLVTPSLFDHVISMKVYKHVYGSDHAPIELVCDISLSSTKDIKSTIIKEISVIAQKEAINNNPFKVRAYQKVIQQIKKLDKVTTIEDLDNVSGVGVKIKAKIEEIINTGALESAKKAREDPNITMYEQLIRVYGIGPTKAKELIDKDNITSLDELKKHPELLNDQQRIGLKYYDDLNKVINREELNQHNNYLKKIFKKLDLEYEITGSYRRGSSESGDIDILVCSDDNSSLVLDKIIKTLIKNDYIIEALALGKKKFNGIACLNNGIARRIDILVTNSDEYPFALLYFTWGQQINIELRKRAQKMGLKLNEKGLWDKKGNKIKLTNEQAIFDYLGLDK